MNERTDTDGKRLAWGVVTIAGLVLIAYMGWLGISVTSLQADVASMSAKLDIVLADRQAHLQRKDP